MLLGKYFRYDLVFKQAAGTSRGILHTKPSWFIFLQQSDNSDETGIGECSIIEGLSPDPLHIFENELKYLCANINNYKQWMAQRGEMFPSIKFGLETALLDLKHGGICRIFENDFSNGMGEIPINGLVWMGSFETMKKQVSEKIDAGYNCIKIKVGAIDFEQEIALLNALRQQFDAAAITIRLDANGAFNSDNVFEKLQQLAQFEIHSIEQPVKQGQTAIMAEICEKSPIPIALDEELIGINGFEQRFQLLKTIRPQFIILKPSLLGGFRESDQWIEIASKLGIGWWITSALESNIGLNATAQWTYEKQITMPQGLGTGQLYQNNISSPLSISKGKLQYKPEQKWDLKNLNI